MSSMLRPSFALGVERAAEVLLVTRLDGYALTQEGTHCALSSTEAAWLFEAAAMRDERGARRFAEAVELFEGELSRVSDADLFGALRDAIERGDVVGVRADSSRVRSTDAVAELRRLARGIERAQEGLLVWRGERYRVVAGFDLARLSDRAEFYVVPQAEAERVLQALARSAGSPLALSILLTEARGKLSADWRPPFEPRGLVLLRLRPPAVVLPRELGAAVTPSQLKSREEPRSWIEIELTDDAGEPYQGDVEIELPNGEKRTGRTGGDGVLRLDGISSGTCKVVLVGLDDSSYEEQGA